MNKEISTIGVAVLVGWSLAFGPGQTAAAAQVAFKCPASVQVAPATVPQGFTAKPGEVMTVQNVSLSLTSVECRYWKATQPGRDTGVVLTLLRTFPPDRGGCTKISPQSWESTLCYVSRGDCSLTCQQ